jgi:chromosome segregation ATPase
MADTDENMAPVGWTRKEIVRKRGLSKGKVDVYFYSPKGKLFRSKKQLQEYIVTHDLPLNIEDFNFKTDSNYSSNQENIKNSHNAEDRTVLTLSMENSGIDVNNTVDNEQVLENENVYDLEDSREITKFELSQEVLHLSESISQLKFEKENAETSLIRLESEAEDTILQLNKEIDILKLENGTLKEEVKRKDDEIVYIKNQCLKNSQLWEKEKMAIVDKTKKKNEDECKTFKSYISDLEAKINDLKRQNLQLMEAIQPCPLPDIGLVKELQSKDKEIEYLQKKYQDDLRTAEEVIRLLSADCDKLREELVSFKEENMKMKQRDRADHLDEDFILVKNPRNKIKISTSSSSMPLTLIKNRFDCLGTSISTPTDQGIVSLQNELDGWGFSKVPRIYSNFTNITS